MHQDSGRCLLARIPRSHTKQSDQDLRSQGARAADKWPADHRYRGPEGEHHLQELQQVDPSDPMALGSSRGVQQQ